MQVTRPTDAKINSELLRPLMKTGPWWYATAAISGALLLAAIFAFGLQLTRGIGVWGLNRPVMWAFDITNFVFWIGISHAGTLISAILRVTGAEWRRPVTRSIAEIKVPACDMPIQKTKLVISNAHITGRLSPHTPMPRVSWRPKAKMAASIKAPLAATVTYHQRPVFITG